MATTDQNLILNLPFDEAPGATIAYDYGQNRYDATVVGATFAEGKQGNCIDFKGDGTATISRDILNLAANFTILAWVKVTPFADGYSGRSLGVFCNTGQLEGYADLWFDIDPGTWGFITIKKSGNRIEVYLDTKLKGTITVPYTMTGISLLQDLYGTPYAFADLDEVKIYDRVISDGEIEELLNTISQLEYYLDGVNLKDFGIRVESSKGVLDLPKMKTPASNDWPDYHGKVIDLTAKRYEEREITLNCWVKATGKMDFVERVNKLNDILRKDGTARLMISIHPIKPLVYEVYNDDGVAHDKKWHDNIMMGTFTLKLKEPDPVKRVVRHQRTSAATAAVSVAFKSDKMVNIYWGDGTVTEDLYGDHTGNNAVAHTYATNGIYYIVIGGVIEEITDFSTTGIIIWSRL